jgi:hypothetical protein
MPFIQWSSFNPIAGLRKVTRARIEFQRRDDIVAAMPQLPFDSIDTPDSSWWSEGGEEVYIEDGRLFMLADAPMPTPGPVTAGGVCTAWCKQPLPADLTIEMDAHVISSTTDANNINLFFCYSDPSGKPLYDTRDERSDAGYGRYHVLNGHIITFLNGKDAGSPHHEDGGFKSRVRIRRCPGFQLLAETFAGRCRQNETYSLRVTKRGGEIVFSVNGTEYLRTTDPNPLPGGLLGLRTFRTRLWWGNVRVSV